jgi:glycosyltransferase involved in cell wall biosynthesis
MPTSQSSATHAFRPCIVIPYYNHPLCIAGVVAALRPLGVPCILVDDASNADSNTVLENLSRLEGSWLRVVRHARNEGKGGAVMTGCNTAHDEGFTHAVQIDADGQHDSGDVPKLLALAQRSPRALITGIPQYDDSVPRIRLYGRYLTHVWVWINTISLQVKDSMCGLRVYPLAESVALWRSVKIGRRMDFDTEVIVRLVWRGIEVINFPTRVVYPRDGVSHFDALRDNVRISRMHTRLFFGMLWRSPMLIARLFGRLVGARKEVL